MSKNNRVVKSIFEIARWAFEYLIVAILFFGLGYYMGVKADMSNSYDVHETYKEDCKEENNMDRISMFMKWADISDDEKMEAINALVNAECYNLGLYDKLNIEISDDMPETKLGSYSDINKKIVINKKYFDESDGLVIMETIIHECYHNYEARMVDTLSKLSSEERSLTIFRSVNRYSAEFNEYNQLKKDFDDYYNLNVEVSARKWSEKRIESYTQKIMDYLNTEER